MPFTARQCRMVDALNLRVLRQPLSYLQAAFVMLTQAHPSVRMPRLVM